MCLKTDFIIPGVQQLVKLKHINIFVLHNRKNSRENVSLCQHSAYYYYHSPTTPTETRRTSLSLAFAMSTDFEPLDNYHNYNLMRGRILHNHSI